MEILYYLIPIAIFFAGGMLVLFLAASQHGQFDDLETPATRLLIPEEESSGVDK